MRKVIKIVLFIVGLSLCFFPLISGIMEQQYLKDAVATYQKEVETIEIQNLEEELEKARLYNATLFDLQEKIIHNTSGQILSNANYQSLLNLTNNAVMGSVEIPKIGVTLPIYHGTSEEVLVAGAGHVEESSLPIGGTNTRTIITSHRGLPNAKLFTRLDELEKGDLFYIQTLQEILAYQVIEIQVIDPENVEVLKIVPDKDLATLLTCTPYGINTHRLVVTGERVPYVEQVYEEIEQELMSPRELIFLCLPFLFLMIGIRTVGKELRKRKKGEHAKTD